MARQQRKMLPAQPLPPPPSKLSRSAAAKEYEGRKMAGKNGDTLVRVGRGTEGRHRMRKGGSPDSETPTPTAWPHSCLVSGTHYRKTPDALLTQIMPVPARSMQNSNPQYQTKGCGGVCRKRLWREGGKTESDIWGGQRGSSQKIKSTQLTASYKWKHGPCFPFHRLPQV